MRRVTRRARTQEVKEQDKDSGQDTVSPQCMLVLFTALQPHAARTARALAGNGGWLRRIYSVTPMRQGRRRGRMGRRAGR